MGLIVEAVTRKYARMNAIRRYPWFYHLPFDEYNGARRNATNERIAYIHIHKWMPHKAYFTPHAWHETLAFLGIEEE